MRKDNLLDAILAQTTLSKKQTDKQQKIILTTIKLFAEKGYANTSTSEIAKAADVAEGTIFRHYGTKENLLLSVILPFLKESIPSMAEEVFKSIMTENVGSFEDFLRALIRNRMNFIKENKEIFQIVVKELLYDEDLRKELMPHFFENVIPRLLKVIELYQERGELRDYGNIPTLIFTFIGGYFISRFVLQADDSVKDEEAEIDTMVQFVMNGIQKQSQRE